MSVRFPFCIYFLINQIFQVLDKLYHTQYKIHNFLVPFQLFFHRILEALCSTLVSCQLKLTYEKFINYLKFK